MIINNINIVELQYAALLQFSQTLYNELIKERKNRSLQQIDKDRRMVFWRNTKDNIEKLKYDEYSARKTAEQNTSRINDLETRLRRQHAYYSEENNYNLEKIRLENEEAERKISSKCQKQIDELFESNSSLQDIVKNKDLQHRNQMNYMRQEHAEFVSNETEKFEDQIVQVLGRMDDRRLESDRQVKERQLVELQNYQSINDRNIKYTTETYNSEIVDLTAYYNVKHEKAIALTQNLKDAIQKYVDKNQYLNQCVLDMKKDNRKLVDDLRLMENNNQYLEREKNRIGNSTRRSRGLVKDLKSYESLFKLKRQENEMLEKNNAEMRQALNVHDDYP